MKKSDTSEHLKTDDKLIESPKVKKVNKKLGIQSASAVHLTTESKKSDGRISQSSHAN